MARFLLQRSPTALALLFLTLRASAAGAQYEDVCRPPGDTVVLGSEVSITWRMRAGYGCAARIRIGYRHAVQSISVARRPQFGQAGASTDRGRDEVGRTVIQIAYRSPAKAKAGEDAFTVRVVTRDKESGEIKNTLLNYRMELF